MLNPHTTLTTKLVLRTNWWHRTSATSLKAYTCLKATRFLQLTLQASNSSLNTLIKGVSTSQLGPDSKCTRITSTKTKGRSRVLVLTRNMSSTTTKTCLVKFLLRKTRNIRNSMSKSLRVLPIMVRGTARLTKTAVKMIYNILMKEEMFNLVAGTKTTHLGLLSVMSRIDSYRMKPNMRMDRISTKTNPKTNRILIRIISAMVALRKSYKISWSKCSWWNQESFRLEEESKIMDIWEVQDPSVLLMARK